LVGVVRKGYLEVHAYSVLPTHFHLLVRSLKGELWMAMKELEEGYAQRFNVQRSRPGPLFQGRYKTVLVESAVYWETVYRYIDRNAPKAGLAQRAADYPYGSAYAYFNHKHRWLARTVVERAVAARAGPSDLPVGEFGVLPGGPLSSSLEAMVEEDLMKGVTRTRLLDDLISMDVGGIRRILEERAQSADAFGVITGVLPPEAVRRALEAVRPPHADSQMILAGLLRGLCSVTDGMIAATVGVSHSTARRRIQEHEARLLSDPAYADLCAKIGKLALESEYRPAIVEPEFAPPPEA
jgi:hypothetical protein